MKRDKKGYLLRGQKGKKWDIDDFVLSQKKQTNKSPIYIDSAPPQGGAWKFILLSIIMNFCGFVIAGMGIDFFTINKTNVISGATIMAFVLWFFAMISWVYSIAYVIAAGVRIANIK